MANNLGVKVMDCSQVPLENFLFPLAVVYERPLDYPEGFIVRFFDIDRVNKKPVATDYYFSAEDLETCRTFLKKAFTVKFGRDPYDPRSVVESWII